MIKHGCAIDVLKTLEANSVDSIVTDPPYGLSFMGKKWDYDVPSVELWREALRVLKPGGHLLSFGGTRTYHRMVVNIEDAGFEIRDQVMWLYGSGFPKSHNLPGGFGTALKPANEPICVARKPLEKGLTIAANVLKYGTGAMNIDASRIATDEVLSIGSGKLLNGLLAGGGADGSNPGSQYPQGRWPANLILDEAAAKSLGEPSRFFYIAKASKRERNAGLEGMPLVKLQDYAEGTRRKLVAQAENHKNPNLARANFHPTVKPIKLMEYLIKLVTPPCGIVLDPFMGSGTTGKAAKNLDFEFIGIEREAEYVAIAEKRMAND